MKNRPDESGHWWWQDVYGRSHVVELDEDMETYDSFSKDWAGVTTFELDGAFKRWLGKVVPPANDAHDICPRDIEDIPNEPGVYRWEDHDGIKHVIEFNAYMNAVGMRGQLYCSVDTFDAQPRFKRWLGKVESLNFDRYDICPRDIEDRD